MKIITSSSKDPYFNIAAEEFMFKNWQENILFLYINRPCVIFGKHQNPMAEINPEIVEKNKITLVRRLSGGGTVYHDEGNINFCFIQNVPEGNLVDFKRYTLPFIELLENMGIKAELGLKNDLKIDKKKISGNAEHIWKKKVLHHGTLLFDSNLEMLHAVLSENDNNYESKAVKSNRSKTTNITNYLPEKININDFKQRIIDFFLEKFDNSQILSFSKNDISEIQTLVEQKYSTWEWTYGYSPKYCYKSKIKHQNIIYDISLDVEKGEIINIDFINQKISIKIIDEIKNQFLGKKHNEVYAKFSTS
ncbi:MAG: lipoate--protein ligase [Bacteroidales bacterium]|nr:lipoate--protein ligase [Bacteroidales bacterium]